ncbi:MAG: hypothetical protein ACPF9K_06180 [Neptuniibacter sp.]
MNELSLLLVLLILFSGIVYWVVSVSRSPLIVVSEDKIQIKAKGNLSYLNLDDLAAIKLHYHAVVGFKCLWEFIDSQGQSMMISGETKGINEALSDLEKVLPNFSISEVEGSVKNGDVEDILNVWKRENKDC